MVWGYACGVVAGQPPGQEQVQGCELGLILGPYPKGEAGPDAGLWLGLCQGTLLTRMQCGVVSVYVCLPMACGQECPGGMPSGWLHA